MEPRCYEQKVLTLYQLKASGVYVCTILYIQLQCIALYIYVGETLMLDKFLSILSPNQALRR